MTPEQIDDLIERAGLSEVLGVYASAIEVGMSIRAPDGPLWDGYSALAALVDEARRQERERAAQIVDEWMPTGRASDMNALAAAIRALS